MDGRFDDILDANRAYADRFRLAGLSAPAAKGLGVLTCIDSRIEPLAMLGLSPGDAKIVRNAGARATDDAVRSLVLATNLLAVRRIMVVAHTDCAMARHDDDEIRELLGRDYPAREVAAVEFHAAAPDPDAALTADVERIRRCPLLPSEVTVAGFRYDVGTGLLHAVVD